jgi:putative phosphoribosyl transferase
MEKIAQEHEWARLVDIETGDALLEGELTLPRGASAVVLFIHGSGSSRHSPRNRNVARSLRARAGVGTLLFDLLTDREEVRDQAAGVLRFDVGLLARRVEAATDWALRVPTTRLLRLGYFGASTGAAAALLAASQRPDDVGAIVSRGGRPDLVDRRHLAGVRAPTLFVVGGEDYPVLDWNRAARDAMTVEARLDVVPGAGHLFEERGALEEVARRSADWFRKWLGPPASSRPT